MTIQTIARIVAALALAGVSFYLGWAAHPDAEPVVITEGSVQQSTTKQVEAKATKHSVKTTEKKPDGTTVTTQTVDLVTNKETNVQADKEVETQTTVAVAQPAPQANWSVGVKWHPSLSDPDYRPQAAEIGRRVAGPFWVTGEYDWKQHSAEVGVRMEF